MKILLPVDGSVHTKHMLSYIAAHEELLGKGHAYTLFTVVASVPPHVTHFIDQASLDTYYADQAEVVFKPLQAFSSQQGWDVDRSWAKGPPAEAIADKVHHDKFDLIVMGSHGHSSLANVVLGSVAAGVLARCKVPVLLIR
jgi:nucleotide-binding universal stress UspA family protein